MGAREYPQMLPPQVSQLHGLLIGRIYHEDQLFAQRTYVLCAIQTFFLIAFASLLSTTRLLALFLTVLGLGLAIFQALFGRQSNRAIDFWRAYAHLIEAQ